MRDLSNCNILVVDDNESNIEILANSLSDDYEVSVATSGGRALKIASETPPDLILLDIMMPEMDGYEVCRRLKANPATRDIPVIFCTALTRHADEMQGLDLGAVDYIRKPLSPSIVKTRVRNYLMLKRALEDLADQNQILTENARLRDDVERMVRHDIKTPLNSIINIPTLITSDENLTASQVELMEIIEESGYRILEIVNSSMDLFRMEKGEYRLNPVPVDLIHLVRQVRGETRSLINSKNIELFLTFKDRPVEEGDVFSVEAEELMAYSMLANLVKNAVEASPPSKRVTIQFLGSDSKAVVIQNEGAVPEEIRDTFFDKYATVGKKGGMGLGTYSARLIAQAFGGDLTMTTSEQSGTTLVVQFPGKKKTAERDEASAEASSGKGRRLTVKSLVLVADDYQNMRKTIINMLKKMGFTIFVEAADGQAALEFVDRLDIGLIISDMNMPELSGTDLLRSVRSSERNSHTPFIMVTGEAGQENVLEAVKAQVTDYIVKPFSADVLTEKIERLLER